MFPETKDFGAQVLLWHTAAILRIISIFYQH
jgi:hypothetical protein